MSKEVNQKQAKKTQGNQKLKQYLEDLKRNKYFIQKMDKIKTFMAEETMEDIKKDEAILGELLSQTMTRNLKNTRKSSTTLVSN